MGNLVGHNDVDLKQWALVGDALRGNAITADDFQLALRVQAAIGYADPEDGAPSAITISLPDLDAHADLEIVRDNVVATQALYFSAALDDMQFFGVADKIRELFQLGMLPFGKSRGGDLIFAFTKKGINRMTEVERRNLYARTFGFPGGDPERRCPNREFSDLWLRFVSAVSELGRQVNLDDLLTARRPGSVSQEQVRKAGRDLAANLSLHGYGVGYFAATELQTTIKEIIDILSSEDVKNAYGARDMCQVIDQVAALELGGARNTTRYRTIAQAGRGDHRLARRRAGSCSAPRARPRADRPERDLQRRAARRERQADRRSRRMATWSTPASSGSRSPAPPTPRSSSTPRPSEGPTITSRPIQIPSIVPRDLLASVGLSSNGQ